MVKQKVQIRANMGVENEDISLHNSFTISVELCSYRTSHHINRVDQLHHFIEQAGNNKNIDFIAIGENSHVKGYSQISFADYLLKEGITPLIYCSLQGKSEEQFNQSVDEFAARGLKHIVIVGGDYPQKSNNCLEPVFDLDSVQALYLLKQYSQSKKSRNATGLRVNNFKAGCVVSPFKQSKYELLGQYGKLLRKFNAGADFVISQIGYSLKKFAELKQFFTENDLGQQLWANIFIPGPKLTQNIVQGHLPGVALDSETANVFMSDVGASTGISDKSIDYIAKRIAVIKGLGFNGVHLGGPSLTNDCITSILAQAEQYGSSWQEIYENDQKLNGTFYYLSKDQINLSKNTTSVSLSVKKYPHPMFAFSWLVDWAAFSSNFPIMHILKSICSYAENKKWLGRFIYLFEQLNKSLLYNCSMCGDCSLYTSSFVCVQANCPKGLLNGPCGGSCKGYCEVSQGELRCCWVDVYKKCVQDNYSNLIHGKILMPKNKELSLVSSWMNYFAGRDHQQRGKKGENGMF